MSAQRFAIHCFGALNAAAFWKSTLSDNLPLAVLVAVAIVLLLLTAERRDI